MIQRKQSLWLLLAALFGAGATYFDLYRATGSEPLNALSNYAFLLLGLVITILPLFTVFLFRNRKRQKTMTFISILANLGFIGLLLAWVAKLHNQTPPPTSGTYWIGAIFPAFSIVLLVMALVGINKDDKLVKSMDRLR